MSCFPTSILLASDGSEEASLALRAAVNLAVLTKAELHIMYALNASPGRSHSGLKSTPCKRTAQRVLFRHLDEIDHIGGVASGAHLIKRHPIEAISYFSEKLDVDLIMIGSRGLGSLKRFIMGSVSEGTVNLASRPVLVHRGGPEAWPPTKIIVGDDGSDSAEKSAKFAVGIGQCLGAEVVLVRAHPVILPLEKASMLSKNLTMKPCDTKVNRELALMGRARGLAEYTSLRPRWRAIEGEAASVLLGLAKDHGRPTLIAMGKGELGRIDRLRLGSVSKKVLRSAAGPVLICPS